MVKSSQGRKYSRKPSTIKKGDDDKKADTSPEVLGSTQASPVESLTDNKEEIIKDPDTKVPSEEKDTPMTLAESLSSETSKEGPPKEKPKTTVGQVKIGLKSDLKEPTDKEALEPEYGEITDYTKRDLYKLICRYKGLNLDSKNSIVKVFEKKTSMTLKELSNVKEKNINGKVIDTVFQMYRNICTGEGVPNSSEEKQNVLIKDIAPTLIDIIEYAFKFIKNSYERRKILDAGLTNRAYSDAIEAIYSRVK